MKRGIKRLIVIAGILAAALVGYGIYLFTAWHRLPENLTLEVNRNAAGTFSEESPGLKTGEFYWAMTYDIAYGAYRGDAASYSEGGGFFRAKDRESVMAAVCAMGEIISNVSPDFVFLQEVDTDSTRSFGVDEPGLINQFVKGYYYSYAWNCQSPYWLIPPWRPYGANRSGLMTCSRPEMTESIRKGLPITESLFKYTDLDACYMYSRIPVETGEGEKKTLCIYNVHLSAFAHNRDVRKKQLVILYEAMAADYKRGDYVICGGNLGQDLKGSATESVHQWAEPFRREEMPEGFYLAIDDGRDTEDILQDTARSTQEPYEEGRTDTVTLDGFILSDNITVNYYYHMDWDYEYSSHEPVIMQFRLE